MDFHEWIEYHMFGYETTRQLYQTNSKMNKNGRFKVHKKQLGHDNIRQFGSTQAKTPATWV
jgi:hypothetical protein